MSPEVFRRLALIVACSAWVVALALVWTWLGWPIAVAAFFGGPAIALVLSMELAPETPVSPSLEAGRQGLGHREIGRRARAAREDDDE